MFDDEGVASAVECVVGGEGSAVLCAEEFQRLQDAVEVEFLEPEGYDSWSLVFTPPASYLLSLLVGKIVEELSDSNGCCGDCSELLGVKFALNIPLSSLFG